MLWRDMNEMLEKEAQNKTEEQCIKEMSNIL